MKHKVAKAAHVKKVGRKRGHKRSTKRSVVKA